MKNFNKTVFILVVSAMAWAPVANAFWQTDRPTSSRVQVYCPMILSPVRGAHGVTYGNACLARQQGQPPIKQKSWFSNHYF